MADGYAVTDLALKLYGRDQLKAILGVDDVTLAQWEAHEALPTWPVYALPWCLKLNRK
ncbi:MAG: hypothetical protein JO035_11790 [Betaproteobacteria bacterium]|nr:hypothetical protein [Betaproteobacteria bacterium]